MADHGHIPVLLEETVELLSPRPGEVAVDCTIGRGGHAAALAKAVGVEGRLVGFDLDRENLDYSARRVAEAMGRERGDLWEGLTALHDSFVRMPDHLREMGLKADIVLADLGFCSSQMDDPGRGLGFSTDGPLDMRLDPTGPVTAADLLATLPEKELQRIIGEYGEEPFAGRIARKLAQNRDSEPIRTTSRLARLVEEAYGRRAHSSRMHPATRTFMALRIAVNDELAALEGLLAEIVVGCEGPEEGRWLNAGARIAIISFHSLEDRLVKRAFAELAKHDRATRLTKRPVEASEKERQENPRSRSAKLRAVRMADPPERK
ncbi:MAG: 16S rRNA (cytosine(1402)-N(4))-methyltransferase RsmH [Phycisphaerales bacterium]|nr:MAG: 16S rRNA (cytosine(1402)-N(4))-methyltransferase RsmH [Phycisphaerales bacterium]